MRYLYRIKKFKTQFCNLKCLGKWRSKNLIGERSSNWKRKFSKEWKNNIRLATLNVPHSLATIKTKQAIVLKKYPIDIHYFDKINHKNAYLLGYFFADGCMFYYKCNHNKFHSKKKLGFSITSIDKELINIVVKELKCFKHKIKINLPNNDYQNKSYCIQFANAHLLKRLFNLGLIVRKSKRISIPKEIKEKYFFDFLRGFFDGDGWISAYTYAKKPKMNFASQSKKFLFQIHSRLNRFSINSTLHKYSKSNTSRLSLYNKNDIEKIYKKLYNTKNKNLYLSRKKKRFDKYFLRSKNGNS